MNALFSLFDEPPDGEPLFSEKAAANLMLTDFLAVCLQKNEAAEMLSFLRRPADTARMAAQQRFFASFVASEPLRDLFAYIIWETERAERLENLYRNPQDACIKHFLFFWMTDLYVALLNHVKACAAAYPESEILTAFFASVGTFCD